MSIPTSNPYVYQGTLAQGERVRLVYVAETTPGTTPTSNAPSGTYTSSAGSFALAASGPTMKVVRATSRSINATKSILKSNEVRADRQVATLRHGMQKVEGTIGTELGLLTYDDLLIAAMSATSWSTFTATASSNANSTGFSRGAGSYIVDGFRAGDIIAVAGSGVASNDTLWRVTAVTATFLTVDASNGPPISDSETDMTITVQGKRCDIGTHIQTFTIERQFLDTGLFQIFRGVAVDGITLKVASESIPTVDYPLIGIIPGAMTMNSSAGAITEAPTNDPFVPFQGNIYEGGVNIAVITAMDLTLANGRALAGVVGSVYSPAIFEGQAMITGTLSVFVKDADFFGKFLNETLSSIYLQLFDPDGINFHNVVLNHVKYTGDTINPPAVGGVVEQMPFQALVDPVTGTSMSWQKSNTP